MRHKLPDTRFSATRKVSVGNWEMYLIVGFYDNRQPGEVFVKIASHGSVVSGLMDGICISLSLGLQYGIPMAELIRKFEHTKFEPCDQTYSSLLDALCKNLMEVVRDGDGDPEKPHGLDPVS